MKSLRVEGLSAGYGGRRILSDISFELSAGRTLGVLGPSGSGKSTLLLCLAGLLRPEAGRVLLDGKDITDLAPERRGIVLLHQENTLFPHLDVAGNVAFGLREKRVQARERAEKVRRLLDLVGLAGFEKLRVDEISGGERQRVALARALAVDPAVLLLDEPMGALDRALRVRLREELRKILGGLGVTTIFVTHDQEEAAWLGDELLLLEEGRVLDRGEASALARFPSQSAVARLMGRRNLLPFERTEKGRLRTALGEFIVRGEAPSKGVLLVREEDIVVRPASGRSGLQGELLEARPLGSHLALRLRVGEVELLAEAAHPEVPLARGPVRVTIPPGDVHPMPR